MANHLSNNLSAFSINAAGGALTAVSGSPIGAGTLPISIAIDPSGLFAYVANDSSNDISVYSLISSTGAAASVAHSPFAAGNEPRSIAID